MAEKEYIELGKVIDLLEWDNDIEKWVMSDGGFLMLLPADVVEVVHAHWIDRDGKTWCSNCDASNKQYKPPYCPHCGAKMDRERKEA